jgi:hypothetical protein
MKRAFWKELLVHRGAMDSDIIAALGNRRLREGGMIRDEFRLFQDEVPLVPTVR